MPLTCSLFYSTISSDCCSLWPLASSPFFNPPSQQAAIARCLLPSPLFYSTIASGHCSLWRLASSPFLFDRRNKLPSPIASRLLPFLNRLSQAAIVLSGLSLLFLFLIDCRNHKLPLVSSLFYSTVTGGRYSLWPLASSLFLFDHRKRPLFSLDSGFFSFFNPLSQLPIASRIHPYFIRPFSLASCFFSFFIQPSQSLIAFCLLPYFI